MRGKKNKEKESLANIVDIAQFIYMNFWIPGNRHALSNRKNSNTLPKQDIFKF
jgi:hypothetical protein